jgi:hypothetical protein
MLNHLPELINQDDPSWDKFQEMLMSDSCKNILLHEGEISTQIHFIKKGCLLEWFNKDVKDITFQFFFEGQAVASIDSFLNNQPVVYTPGQLRDHSRTKKFYN